MADCKLFLGSHIDTLAKTPDMPRIFRSLTHTQINIYIYIYIYVCVYILYNLCNTCMLYDVICMHNARPLSTPSCFLCYLNYHVCKKNKQQLIISIPLLPIKSLLMALCTCTSIVFAWVGQAELFAGLDLPSC